jgi:thiamine-phosphate pyrophosphorylase
MPSLPDLRLYLVLGAADTGSRPFEEVALQAAEGGVTAVQLRDKHMPARDQVAHAKRLKALLAPRGVAVLVNDRVDVARAADADGVHLGQSDLHPADARRLVGDSMVIGASVHNTAEADAVDRENVDYVGLGPVATTSTKADAEPAIGVQGVQQLHERVGLPAVAIGGVTAATAPSLAAAGVHGLAVISAICGAGDPAAAASELRAAFEAAPVPG